MQQFFCLGQLTYSWNKSCVFFNEPGWTIKNGMLNGNHQNWICCAFSNAGIQTSKLRIQSDFTICSKETTGKFSDLITHRIGRVSVKMENEVFILQFIKNGRSSKDRDTEWYSHLWLNSRTFYRNRWLPSTLAFDCCTDQLWAQKKKTGQGVPIKWVFPEIGEPLVIIHFERWDFPVHKNHPASLGYPHDELEPPK